MKREGKRQTRGGKN